MDILLIDNFDSFTYNLFDYFRQFNGVHVEVIRNNVIDINSIIRYDAIVLSPGPGLPHESGMLLQVIQEFFDTKPILGVCLGMQALAVQFGAALHNLDKVFHGYQDNIIKVNEMDKLLTGLPKKFKVGRYHSWCVNGKTLPKDWVISSVDVHGNPMSMFHRNFPLFGVQFHPESIMTPFGKAIIQNFINQIDIKIIHKTI